MGRSKRERGEIAVARGTENRCLARARYLAHVPTVSAGEELDRESTEEGATLAAGEQPGQRERWRGDLVDISVAGLLDVDQRQLGDIIEPFKASRAQQAKLLLSVLNATGAVRRAAAGARALYALDRLGAGDGTDAAILDRRVRTSMSATVIAPAFAPCRCCSLGRVLAAAVHPGARLG